MGRKLIWVFGNMADAEKLANVLNEAEKPV